MYRVVHPNSQWITLRQHPTARTSDDVWVAGKPVVLDGAVLLIAESYAELLPNIALPPLYAALLNEAVRAL